MKKLMIAASAAVWATVGLAVDSSNIVGYTSKEAAQGKFIILGAQFESVSGGTKINDVLAGVTGVDYDEGGAFLSTAPQIQIPAAVGYTVCYYLNDGWYDDGSETGAFKPGWCDDNGSIVDVSYTPGVALWLKSVGADADANVSGAVPSDDSVAISCPATFALRANAYPVAFGLNSDSFKVANIAGVDYDEGGAFLTTAPQVQIPAAVGYTVCYYLNDGWYDDGSETGAFKPGWCDDNGSIVDTTVPAAQGFWTKGVGSAFTATFSL